MLWGCSAASVTGGIECIKEMMKSEDYRGIWSKMCYPVSVSRFEVKVLGLSAGQWTQKNG